MSVAVALSVGLLQGSLHCAGMCGPFVLAFSLAVRHDRARPGALLPLHLAHNAGRVAAFTALGAVFGWIGSFVDAAAGLTGLQAAAGIVGGGLMIAWAADQVRTGHGAGFLERWSPLQAAPVQRVFRRLLGGGDLGSAFAAGLLLGLHPCGLIFAVLLAAAATGSPLTGAATLLAFGVGTVPALLGVAAAGTWGGRRLRGRGFSYAAAGIIAAGGLLFALRGMAVNGWVPHVQPWLF
jgi:sulfite exporter TauE/SafE